MASRQQLFVLGITGPTAAGKSTLARLFAELGARVLDADQIGREVVRPGEPGLAEVIAEFGPRFLTPAGELERAELGRLIFQDEAARQRLNRLLHPRIGARLAQEIAAARAAERGGVLVLDAAVLYEAGWDRWTDGVLLVTAEQSERLERLTVRQGSTEAEARLRVSGQPRADSEAGGRPPRWVIRTDAPLPEVRPLVEAIWREIQTGTKLARPAPDPPTPSAP